MRSLKRLSWPYYGWMGVFIVVPGLFIVLSAVSTYHAYDVFTFRFTLEHARFLSERLFVRAFLNSWKYAGMTTLVCLLIGYPVAHFLARMKSRNKTLLVALLIVPVWSNMIVRIKAWESIFRPVSILNVFNIGFDMIGTDAAIVLAMVSMYLPFMVFPIYAVLQKMDDGYVEAAQDLGANRFQTFARVTLPLSMGGVVSGVIMTLLPAMTAFVLPERIGGGRVVLLGNLIEKQFLNPATFNIAASVSLVVMLIMLGLFALIVRVDKEGETLL